MSTDPLLPGVPLIESPLFAHHLATHGWSDAEREVATALNEKGYAVIDFPDPEIDARISRIKARLERHFGIRPDDPASIAGITERRIQDAWAFDEDVRAIAANEEVLNLLGRLYGRPAFPFQTLNFPVGTQQAAHTDAVHFSSIPERFMCGVWLAMEDISLEAGPLMYVPGSHRWPVLSNTMIGRRGWQSELHSAQAPFQQVWSAMVESTGAVSETFAAKKGQALIWCANLLHGGSPQSNRALTRWSQVTHYFFDDCVYYTPAFSDEPLGRLALRQIVNIADGARKPNRYLGEDVSPAPPPSRKGGFARWLGGVLTKRRSRS
jgi:Protein involved in biosynthesis of mitomycin antibiotics/polyketide fumonisin